MQNEASVKTQEIRTLVEEVTEKRRVILQSITHDGSLLMDDLIKDFFDREKSKDEYQQRLKWHAGRYKWDESDQDSILKEQFIQVFE